jgi:hypothetical protein
MNKSYQEQHCCQNNANDGLGVNPNFVQLDELVVSSSAILKSKSKLQSGATVGLLGMTDSVLASNSVQVNVSGSSGLELAGCGCCPSGNLLGFSDDSETESVFEFLNAGPTESDFSEWVMNHYGLDRVDNFWTNQEHPEKYGTSNKDQSAIYGFCGSSCGCEGNECKCSDKDHQGEVSPARSRTVDVGFEHVQNTTPQQSELNQLLLAKKGN